MTYDDLVLVQCVIDTHDAVLCYEQYLNSLSIDVMTIAILVALAFAAYMAKFMYDGRDCYGSGG